jgi:hypothetical protein
VKSLRTQCIELLTEIEARLDFDDEMPPLDLNLIMAKIHAMSQDVENALETANYDKLLQSGLQVQSGLVYLHVYRGKLGMDIDPSIYPVYWKKAKVFVLIISQPHEATFLSD